MITFIHSTLDYIFLCLEGPFFVQQIFVLLVWNLYTNSSSQWWYSRLHIFLTYFGLYFIWLSSALNFPYSTKELNLTTLPPLLFYLNSLTLYLTINITTTINSDNLPPFYIFWCSFTRTWPSCIWFSYLLRLASICLHLLQLRLNIISNSDSQMGILNLLPLQCFYNITILHQHYLACECGIGECIYLFFQHRLDSFDLLHQHMRLYPKLLLIHSTL